MFARSVLAIVALAAVATVNSAQAAWTEKVLYNFSTDESSATGYFPRLGVLIDGTDMYGSTNLGGKKGGGIIFRRSGNKVTVLYSFTNGDDGVVKGCGYSPSARLIRAANGTLFGTTSFGGEGSGGVIFKLTADPNHPNAEWTCQVLYPFVSKGPDVANGYAPFGGLLRAADGTLYGTAQKGGKFGGGVVFAIKGGKSTYKVLYAFARNGADAKKGYGPAGALAMDGSDVLYGTTFFGGGPKGGVIYKIAPPYAESDYQVIHQFSPGTGSNGAEFGYQPTQGPLLIQGNNLYGETTLGGCPVDASLTPMCPNPNSLPGGVLFTLKTSGSGYTVLHRFDSGEDIKNGYSPFGGLIRAGGGALYGVTQFGGPQAGGVAFRYLNGIYTVLYRFSTDAQSAFGYTPSGGLALDSQGRLVGTTFNGGVGGGGVIFQLEQP